MLALAAPTLAQNPPTGQGSHDVALVAGLNLPTGHDSQLALAGLAAYWPGRQGRQTAPVTGSASVPLGQSAQRGAVQVVGSSAERCTEESHLVPGKPVHASHASAPRGRRASSPLSTQGTSQLLTVAVLPAPDKKSGLHSRQTSPETCMNLGHWKQALVA